MSAFYDDWCPPLRHKCFFGESSTISTNAQYQWPQGHNIRLLLWPFAPGHNINGPWGHYINGQIMVKFWLSFRLGHRVTISTCWYCRSHVTATISMDHRAIISMVKFQFGTQGHNINMLILWALCNSHNINGHRGHNINECLIFSLCFTISMAI